ncbi:MAG: alpha/beta hydrolase family protein [Bradymonadaceae bacterium]
MDAALPAVDRIVTGDMTTLDYLDPATRRFRGDGEARPRRIPFVLTVPETDRAEVPVVIFGHGAKTSRELVYFVANRLAEAGYAAFAVDFPYHGARARGRPGRHEPDDPADGLGNGFADLGLRTDLAETPRVFATTVDRRPTGAPRRRRVSQRTPPVRSSAAKQRPLGTVARDDHTGADADSSDSSPSSGIDRDTLLAEFRGAMIDLELADAIDATDPDLQVDLDPLHERWERAREADFGERTLESAGREIVFHTRRSHDRVTVLA